MGEQEASERRLFVAIDPPEAVRAALAAQARPMRGVNWTPPHQYHLTLRFIGNVAEDRLDAIQRHLAAVEVASFMLPVEGAGSFPPRRPPGVLWIGVGQAHPRLFQLRQRVDDALLASGLTDLDVKHFHPHITIARCGRDVSANQVAGFLHDLREYEGPLFKVDAFSLYQSELGPGGAVHTVRLRVPLQ
jgi:2'-5' RNA ligase